ncbi:hypothetical protein ACVRY7_03265 [Streptococcus ictaluri]|uniref:Cystathionine gamma-synthase n=1 Tax=Streptococcus ictaluri 707-05 TaxID=764299 RepID=G5K1D1_9STRE|nr:hypothetical protein [Streptococcus ictaluri]EHI70115.1 hypothetical protein STRIC_2188 [Streptococcus ictaluri 707-05]
MTKKQFPLVADGEPIIEVAKQMALYDNEDLITNIQGFYQEKDYNDVTRDFQFAENQKLANTSHANSSNRLQTINEGRNYAKEARQKAKQDIKEKRKAYITKEMAYQPKQTAKKSQSHKASASLKESNSELGRFTGKLQQEDYILAELPRQYKEPKPSDQKASQKNNYDFLKRSQIYNNKETRENREKTIAQELNLSRFDDLS